MEVKLFEVRDSGTTVPCIAIKLTSRSVEEKFLLHRAGYAPEQTTPTPTSEIEPYVLFGPIAGGKIEYDPFSQTNRTFKHSHMHAIENWNTLTSGNVIDVEYIKGEKPAPKKSERLA